MSRIIEDLLPQSVHQVRERFMTCFSEDLRIASTDPFQSHVLEKLMKMATVKNAKDDPTFQSFSATWLFKVCKFMVNNFGDFVFDQYASHILRTSFQCLSGVKVADEILRSKRSLGQVSKDESKGETDSEEQLEVTDDMIITLVEGANRALEWEDKKGKKSKQSQEITCELILHLLFLFQN